MSKEALKLALHKAFNLGSIYWQQVDSEFSSNWKKGDVTKAQFDQLVEDTIKHALEQPVQEPVAWRTFDGEGGYEYRTYDTNEDYADDWEKRNPNHKGWVEPLYKDPTPCQTCEALARTVMMDQTAHDTTPPAAQRPWVGLTDEEIDKTYETQVWEARRSYARAIEAKLKEKNT
jgi:hypothetical protein